MPSARRWSCRAPGAMGFTGSATCAAGASAPASVDPGARGGLTLAHLPLFLRGAALTVVVSVLAMALAVLGGLGLCLARRYGGRMWRARQRPRRSEERRVGKECRSRWV